MISQLFPYTKLSIGDTWSWSIYMSQYPASSGWTLSYVLKLPGAEAKTITAIPDTDGVSHLIKVNAAENGGYLPGRHRAYVYITSSDSDRQTLGSCDLEILPDLASADAAFDPRSYNQICLDTLEAVLQGSCSRDILETTFKDATFKYKSTTELIRLRNYFKQQIDLDSGVRSGRIINKVI